MFGRDVDSFHPYDEGDTFLQNVSSHRRNMASRPKRQHSSEYVLVWLQFQFFFIVIIQMAVSLNVHLTATTEKIYSMSCYLGGVLNSSRKTEQYAISHEVVAL
jgi:hypothetical protein